MTKVVDRKVSHGKTILLLKNTLNGFFKPAMAKVIESYVDEEKPAAAEPIYTCKDAVELIPLPKDYVEGDALEQVTLWGNLCTGMDKIVDDVWLPHMEYGDLFVMTNAGSYAAVLSPMQFSSQTKPEELFLTAEGVVIG